MVQPDDLIFHLGDVIIGPRRHLKPIMESLPGRKILIRGNHDRESYTWYMNNGFDFAAESIVYRNVLLTHHPAPELPRGATINIHGHYHNNPPDRWEFAHRPFHRLLAVEYTKYQPVAWDKFVANAKEADLNCLTMEQLATSLE